jgi:hypothetical protein
MARDTHKRPTLQGFSRAEITVIRRDPYRRALRDWLTAGGWNRSDFAGLAKDPGYLPLKRDLHEEGIHLREIAEHVGVSIPMVSRALSGSMPSPRVIRGAQELLARHRRKKPARRSA